MTDKHSNYNDRKSYRLESIRSKLKYSDPRPVQQGTAVTIITICPPGSILPKSETVIGEICLVVSNNALVRTVTTAFHSSVIRGQLYEPPYPYRINKDRL